MISFDDLSRSIRFLTVCTLLSFNHKDLPQEFRGLAIRNTQALPWVMAW